MAIKKTSSLPIFSSYSFDPRTIASAISAGISIIDKKMRIVWVNKTQEEWFGPLSTIKGRYCYEIYQKRSKICANCPTSRVFRTGASCTSVQKGILADNGNKRYFKIAASPIKDRRGRIVHVLELVQDITEKTRTDREMKRRLHAATEELAYISKLDKQFISPHDISLDRVLCQCVNVVRVLLDSKMCRLSLLGGSQRRLVTRASSGLGPAPAKNAALRIGEGIAGRVAKIKHPLMIDDTTRSRYSGSPELFNGKERLRSALCVPISLKDETLGTISVYDRKAGVFTEDDSRLLSCFANHVAILIDNIKAHKEVHTSYISTIKSLVSMIEARDPYTRGHSEKVTKLALVVASAMKLPKTDKLMLTYSCRLHDIGKIAVPDSILNKPGSLTADERAEVQQHPLKAVDMLSSLKFMELGIPAIRHHHERYDGKGYPDGLEGREIPLLASIISCADAFDAMTSDRAYRPRMGVKEAMAELKANRGRQFNPYVLDTFLDTIKK